MNTKIVKLLVGVILTASVLVSPMLAQAPSAPNARVEGDQLLLLDENDNVIQTIDAPAGAVVAGVLDLNGDGSADVATPTAVVLGDGSLDIDNDGNADYTVPELPFLLWLNKGNHTAVEYGPNSPNWIWSYTLKGMYHDPAYGNFAYLRELGSWFYFATTSGVGSMEGVWAYGYGFPAGQQAQGTTGTWTYFNTNWFANNNLGQFDEIAGYIHLLGLTPPPDSNWRLKERAVQGDEANDWTGIWLPSDDGAQSYIQLRAGN